MTEQSEFVMHVEYCRSCPTHSWCTHHDQQKYQSIYHKLKKFINAEFPNIRIKGNRIPNQLVAVKPAQNKYFNTKTNKYVTFPIIGAFQITLNNQKLFSKKKDNCWPNFNQIKDQVYFKVNGKHRKSVQEPEVDVDRDITTANNLSVNHSFLDSADKRTTFHKNKNNKNFTLTDHFKTYKLQNKENNNEIPTDNQKSQNMTSMNSLKNQLQFAQFKRNFQEYGLKNNNVPQFIKKKAFFRDEYGKKQMIVKLDSIQEESILFQQAQKAKRKSFKNSTKKTINPYNNLDSQLDELQSKFKDFQQRVQHIRRKNKEFDSVPKINQNVMKQYKSLQKEKEKYQRNSKFSQNKLEKTLHNQQDEQDYLTNPIVFAKKRLNNIQEYINGTEEEKNQKLKKIYGEWKLLKKPNKYKQFKYVSPYKIQNQKAKNNKNINIQDQGSSDQEIQNLTSQIKKLNSKNNKYNLQKLPPVNSKTKKEVKQNHFLSNRQKSNIRVKNKTQQDFFNSKFKRNYQNQLEFNDEQEKVENKFSRNYFRNSKAKMNTFQNKDLNTQFSSKQISEKENQGFVTKNGFFQSQQNFTNKSKSNQSGIPQLKRGRQLSKQKHNQLKSIEKQNKFHTHQNSVHSAKNKMPSVHKPKSNIKENKLQKGLNNFLQSKKPSNHEGRLSKVNKQKRDQLKKKQLRNSRQQQQESDSSLQQNQRGWSAKSDEQQEDSFQQIQNRSFKKRQQTLNTQKTKKVKNLEQMLLNNKSQAQKQKQVKTKRKLLNNSSQNSASQVQNSKISKKHYQNDRILSSESQQKQQVASLLKEQNQKSKQKQINEKKNLNTINKKLAKQNMSSSPKIQKIKKLKEQKVKNKVADSKVSQEQQLSEQKENGPKTIQKNLQTSNIKKNKSKDSKQVNKQKRQNKEKNAQLQEQASQLIRKDLKKNHKKQQKMKNQDHSLNQDQSLSEVEHMNNAIKNNSQCSDEKSYNSSNANSNSKGKSKVNDNVKVNSNIKKKSKQKSKKQNKDKQYRLVNQSQSQNQNQRDVDRQEITNLKLSKNSSQAKKNKVRGENSMTKNKSKNGQQLSKNKKQKQLQQQEGRESNQNQSQIQDEDQVHQVLKNNKNKMQQHSVKSNNSSFVQQFNSSKVVDNDSKLSSRIKLNKKNNKVSQTQNQNSNKNRSKNSKKGKKGSFSLQDNQNSQSINQLQESRSKRNTNKNQQKLSKSLSKFDKNDSVIQHLVDQQNHHSEQSKVQLNKKGSSLSLSKHNNKNKNKNQSFVKSQTSQQQQQRTPKISKVQNQFVDQSKQKSIFHRIKHSKEWKQTQKQEKLKKTKLKNKNKAKKLNGQSNENNQQKQKQNQLQQQQQLQNDSQTQNESWDQDQGLNAEQQSKQQQLSSEEEEQQGQEKSQQIQTQSEVQNSLEEQERKGEYEQQQKLVQNRIKTSKTKNKNKKDNKIQNQNNEISEKIKSQSNKKSKNKISNDKQGQSQDQRQRQDEDEQRSVNESDLVNVNREEDVDENENENVNQDQEQNLNQDGSQVQGADLQIQEQKQKSSIKYNKVKENNVIDYQVENKQTEQLNQNINQNKLIVQAKNYDDIHSNDQASNSIDSIKHENNQNQNNTILKNKSKHQKKERNNILLQQQNNKTENDQLDIENQNQISAVVQQKQNHKFSNQREQEKQKEQENNQNNITKIDLNLNDEKNNQNILKRGNPVTNTKRSQIKTKRQIKVFADKDSEDEPQDQQEKQQEEKTQKVEQIKKDQKQQQKSQIKPVKKQLKNRQELSNKIQNKASDKQNQQQNQKKQKKNSKESSLEEQQQEVKDNVYAEAKEKNHKNKQKQKNNKNNSKDVEMVNYGVQMDALVNQSMQTSDIYLRQGYANNQYSSVTKPDQTNSRTFRQSNEKIKSSNYPVQTSSTFGNQKMKTSQISNRSNFDQKQKIDNLEEDQILGNSYVIQDKKQELNNSVNDGSNLRESPKNIKSSRVQNSQSALRSSLKKSTFLSNSNTDLKNTKNMSSNTSSRAHIIKQLYGQNVQQQIKKFPNFIKLSSQKQALFLKKEQTKIIQNKKISVSKLFGQNFVLFDQRSIQPEYVEFNCLIPQLFKIVKILTNINEFLIVRLFQNPKLMNQNYYGVWLCAQSEWRCVIVDDQIQISQKTNKPIYHYHSNNQIWPMILQKALAKTLGGYKNLLQTPCHKLFTMLTGSNSLFFNIKEDPTKNNKILKYISDCENKNFVIHAEKVCKNLQEFQRKQRQVRIYYVLSEKKVNENQSLIQVRQDNKNSFWVKLSKFVQQFKSVQILQLRINHNFCHINLPKSISSNHLTIVQLDFFQQSFGSITVTAPTPTALKTYLYKEQKSNILKLVGEAKQKNKINLFFDCYFSDAKYYVFVQSKLECKVAYFGQNKPFMKVIQEINSQGLKNDYTEYLPIKSVNKQNKQKMPKTINKTKLGETGMSFKSQQDKISRLRQNFVQYLLKSRQNQQ